MALLPEPFEALLSHIRVSNGLGLRASILNRPSNPHRLPISLL